ncbi:MAG: nucleoside hydrolase [SAR202 cluster bacterium]|nr:nucleoside hydrolase [SAR202 cluster bacterium]
MKRIIIDTDPGIDDAAALLLALASPELSVQALTTVYGNGPVAQCTRNAWRILHAAGRLDIPVHQGAGKPLLREPNPGFARHIHGLDALGDAAVSTPPDSQCQAREGHAALEIIRQVKAHPGEITLLALGRMTNLALALAIEPGLAQQLVEVVAMGGAVGVPGNVSPVASANLYEDPEAAAMVWASGAPLVQVGLDVCNQITVSQPQLDSVYGAGHAAAQLLQAITPCLQASYQRRGLLAQGAGVRYNDLPAVAYAINPGLFQTEDLYVAVETGSELCRGQTVADRNKTTGRPPNVKVCLGVDAGGVTEMFTLRLGNSIIT